MPHGDKTFTIPFKITAELTLPKVLKYLPMDKARIVGDKLEPVLTVTTPTNIANALETFVIANDRDAILRILNALQKMEKDKNGLYYASYRARDPAPWLQRGPEMARRTLSRLDENNGRF